MNIDALIGQGDCGDVVAALCSFEGLKGRLQSGAHSLRETLGEELATTLHTVTNDRESHGWGCGHGLGCL